MTTATVGITCNTYLTASGGFDSGFDNGFERDGRQNAALNVPYTTADDVVEVVTWYDIFTRSVGA